jgi:hypothetical protein
MAARGFMCHRKKSSYWGRSITVSSLLAFLTSGDLQNTQKKSHKQLILAFSFFVFQTCFSVSFLFQICG